MEGQDIKYILVSGGVISGVGKGVITSSIGTLLKSLGMRVTAIKIDPYLNIDAGTFSPYEHGGCVCSAVVLLVFNCIVCRHLTVMVSACKIMAPVKKESKMIPTGS